VELKYEFGVYYCKSRFEEKDIPKGAGFRWNSALRRWETTDVSIAKKLCEYADIETAEQLYEDLEKLKAEIEASQATDADIEIPAPEGLEYLPFQKAGIAYALNRKNTLIADEMGLGKTIQAIGVVNAKNKSGKAIERVLVVCPAAVKINWKRELQKWLVNRYRIEILKPTTSLIPLSDENTIYIVNFDLLGKFKGLAALRYDLLVVDEAHYAKNPKTQRSTNLEKLTYVENKIFLTGTPILNRPIELYRLLQLLGLDIPLFGRNGYAHRFCAAHRTRFGWDLTGSSNLEELQEMLRREVMIRRLKKDVLKELPPKFRKVVELDMEYDLSEEQAFMTDLNEKIAVIAAEAELAKASDNDEEYIKRLQEVGMHYQVAFREISKIRHKSAIGKAPHVAEYCKDLLDSTDKVVIFVHHHDVADIIAEKLQDHGIKSVIYTGDIDPEERQKRVDAFQDDPEIRVFIGTIGAAGVGITLTAAANVVFAEMSWVPGDMLQAEDRCYRIGQNDNVLVHYLVVPGSIDAKFAYIMAEKLEVIKASLDGLGTDEAVMSGVITDLAGLPSYGSAGEKDNGKCKKDDSKGDSVESLSDEEIEVVHEAIRIIANYCDGAIGKDGMGFNKFDTHIGKTLASLPFLTPKQALLAKRLVRKYHRQLPEDITERLFPEDQKEKQPA